MRRFFINPANITKERGIITDQEARHISTVLRLKPGRVIALFDGNGTAYQAEITAVKKTTVETKILASHRHQEAPPFLSVAQALIKGNKMDLIIQKATELGVSALLPIITQHCDIKLASASQIGRWQRIAHESCKQCDRPTPMPCHEATPLPKLLTQVDDFSHKIIFWENEATKTISDIPGLQSAQRVLLLIGPEGGFSQQEAESAINHGFSAVSLGPRILRAETASIAAMAIVQFLLGNLNKKSPDFPT